MFIGNFYPERVNVSRHDKVYPELEYFVFLKYVCVYFSSKAMCEQQKFDVVTEVRVYLLLS